MTEVDPSVPDGFEASPCRSNSFPAVNLSTAFLDLFGRGDFSFWQWEASDNRLSTFGSLGADSLEDWMTRIHPRDQAGFSAFIDQLGEKKEPDSAIEYRFTPNRHGDWIRVRHSAYLHPAGNGQDKIAGTLICLIEKLALLEARGAIEALELQIRGSGTRGAVQEPPKASEVFVGSKGFTAHLPHCSSEGFYDRLDFQRSKAVPRVVEGVAIANNPERRTLEEKGLKGLTILLVEDEASVRKLVRKLLEMLGCIVIESPSGRHALSLWPEIRDNVSLILSDIVMPEGVSGWDLATELHHRHPSLPILLTSGYSEFGEDHDLINHPRIAFLQKPYPFKSLRNTLCRLTRESASCHPK